MLMYVVIEKMVSEVSRISFMKFLKMVRRYSLVTYMSKNWSISWGDCSLTTWYTRQIYFLCYRSVKSRSVESYLDSVLRFLLSIECTG
jgi:hypothetical protein